MDPNHWSNYQQYSRLAQGSLSTPHSAFPLLDQAGLGSGLGLTHSLQPHAPLPQRALGTIPAVNYAAAHHPFNSSTMSQIIESMNPLTGGFNAQSLHKAGMSLSQNPLVFESVRSDQQIPASTARFSTASTAVFSPSKSSLFEEHKDPPHTYSSPSVVSQSPSLESSSKGWGLSNFMPASSSNPFGAISSVDLSSALPMPSGSHRTSQPPPAHSAASRHGAIQRNPFSPDGITIPDVSSRTGRSEAPMSAASQVHSLYNMMGFGRQHGHSTPAPSQTPQPQMEFQNMASHEIEDLSSGSQSQNQLYYSIATTSYTSSTPTNSNSFTSSHLTAADINYDPVSPATPLSENQPGETAFPTTVSFTDLNAIGASSHHPQSGSKSRGNNIHGPPSGLSLQEPKEVPQHLHSLMMPQPSSRGRAGSKSQVQQISASVNSPHQHSPISVGSPQAPMSSMGSPQNNVMPSSTVKPAAPPVQAMADSSTSSKPKKPRSRKKPKAEILKNVPPPQSTFNNSQQTGFLSSSQGYSGGNNNNFQSPTSRNVQQFQQSQDNQSLMQGQYGNSTSSSSPQNLMRMRPGMNDNMNSEGGYQVMSSVGNNQVSPISDQSPRSQPQTVENPPMMSMNNSRVSSSPLKTNNNNSDTGMLSGTYSEEQDLMPQQNSQFDLQAFSSQPYMEQLVSGQPVRLIPGNVYSEAMHVAAGLPVFPAPFSYQSTEGSTTIDEAAFSSLFDNTSTTNNKSESQGTTALVENSVVEIEPTPPAPPAKPAATCTNPVDEDDELCNFALPPPELADKDRPMVRQPSAQQSNSNSSSGPALAASEKPEAKSSFTISKSGPCFQDSFMNFLMGKKQETLSSVTTATISEKPQLPKYIPEPRRPPPPPKPPEPEPNQSSTPLSFSEDEDDSNVGTAVKNALSTLDSDSYDSDAPETGSYSVQRTKDLTVKITLQNTLKKQHRSRGRPPKGRGGSSGRGRDGIKGKSAREPTPPPPREIIGRRAKDVAKEKTKKKKKYRDSDTSGDSDSDDDFVPRMHPGGSGSEYDSDKDPVWTPFVEEPKRPVGFGFDTSAILEAKPRKSKKSKRSHKSLKSGHRHVSSDIAADLSCTPVVKVARIDSIPSIHINDSVKSVHTSSSQDCSQTVDSDGFEVGQFLLEKKDLHNYETYPIWRVEQGGMLRKFEMNIDNGHLYHKAVSTYSSWVPSMRAGYVPIRVAMISSKAHAEVVEVMEEFRPKPPADGSLEIQYEDDPLVDHFNVYLQIFLSQSLESSFLAAIRKSQEYFYLVPLEKIDKLIERKLEEIDSTVQWKPRFRDCMRMKPQMREINRPNLKQSCQACENSSPPTIKSVLFHGAAYDRFLLTDLPGADNSSQEFLVGKVAAPYISQYHSLHHFKYRLYQRCRAKVHMVRESNRSQNIKEESILDQCLQNRAWVLKIFEDFKALLER
ncbi:uncharacterized protein LOC143286975 [Babylonia areolata]|uniref:uncharacterized protein LOC143286975 n=1 Tax=Babylonia areolata TaxID=304850 RepID=UPI003FD48149